MIGRKKLYKAGLADGIQISEAISKKQEEAIAYVREEVRSGNQLGSAMSEAIASLGDNIAGLYKYLNSKEKAALYHLNTPIDIKELGEYEKHLLVAMLIELSNDESSSITENQRTYTRAIMQYLEIKNPDLTAQSVPLSNRINSIDSINVQKTFLRVALEFFYLQDNDELSDTQEDFLDCFPLKKETAAEIKSEVSRLFSAVGAEGIAEKYGYIPLEEPEIAEQSEIPCESDEETHVSRTEPEIGVGLDISNLEEITLSGIIHIDQGEACTYKNKIIHFQASMECEGTLEFDTCIIHYGEIPGSGQIVMTKTSSLSVCQCTVENHSCGERMFIDADRIQTGIAFTNSEFLNCCFFLRTQDELALTHCKLSNPGKDFVIACNCLDKKETVITDCDFLFLDTPAFLYDCRDRLHDQHIICCDILRLSSCYVKGNLQLNSPEDCQNTEDRCEPPFLFAAAEISILSSSFFGLQTLLSRERLVVAAILVSLYLLLLAVKISTIHMQVSQKSKNAGLINAVLLAMS